MYAPREAIRAQLENSFNDLSKLFERTNEFASSCCSVKRDDDLEKGIATYRLENVSQPPIELSVLVKAFADSIRPPLEHLIAALVEQSAVRPKAKLTKFPISTSAKKYADQLKSVAGLQSSDLDKLKALQPFAQNKVRAEKHPLALLQAISNKHNQLLYVAIMKVDPDHHRLASQNPVEHLDFYKAKFEEGSRVASVVPSRNDGDAKITSLYSAGPTPHHGGFGIQGIFDGHGDEPIGEAHGRWMLTKFGNGPWNIDEWNQFFEGFDLDFRIRLSVRFAGQNPSFGGEDILRTCDSILRFVSEEVFCSGGLIDSLNPTS